MKSIIRFILFAKNIIQHIHQIIKFQTILHHAFRSCVKHTSEKIE